MIEKFNKALEEFMNKWGLSKVNTTEYSPMYNAYSNDTIIVEINTTMSPFIKEQ